MPKIIRYALRSLIKTKSFTIAALLCLGLGIGATTAIFSIVNAVLFRPLQYPGSDRLVRIYTEFPHFPGGLHKFWVSEPEVFDLQKAHSFSHIGAWSISGVNLGAPNEPLRTTAGLISAGVLPALEVRPLLGRWISPEDDEPGAQKVILLSYGTWKHVFGGNPGIVGKQVYVDSTKSTVIGVMPEQFAFPPGETDPPQIWTALQLDPKSTNRGGHNFSVFGRLRDGVTLGQARSEMAQIVAAIGRTKSPNNHVFSPSDHPVSMYSFYDEVVGNVRRPMLLLLGAVVFVLLIACVNVANLLLARSEGRQKEIAVRRAMGASVRDLLKQFLAEGVLLACAGAILGIVFASVALQLVQAANPGSIPRADAIEIDRAVLLFTLAVSLITGLIFGFAPLLHVSTTRIYDILKANSGRSTASVSSNQFRRNLVIAEMAMSFILLVGAGLMVRGFVNLAHVNAGFNPHGIVTAQISLPRVQYRDDAAQAAFADRLQERLKQLPNVQSATILFDLPPIRPVNDNDTDIEGFVRVPNGPIQNVSYYQSVGDDFFETMGAHIVQGRPLERHDGDPRTPGVVINQTMAHTFWPNDRSVIGRRIRPGFPSKSPWCTVVGVVADLKNGGLDKPTGTELFLPYRLFPARRFYVAVKAKGDPKGIVSSIRSTVSALDPSLPISKIRTMDEVMADANARTRFMTLVLAMFSVLALGLAMVGIYGVISYSVAQRTSEFGIRIALGAGSGMLLWQVLRQGISMAIIGGIAGVLGALLLTRTMEGMTFGVGSLDAQSFAAAAAFVLFTTIAASYFPALRATKVEPATALRYE